MTPDQVRAVLARWFPDEPLVVTRAGGGVSTPVFRVQSGEETMYARLGEEPGERRDGEVATHRLLSGHGLPVPAVVVYEAEPPELDRSMALTTEIPGIALADAPDALAGDAAAHAAGATLAIINQSPVRGYGWVTGLTGDDMLRAEHESRAGWAAEYLQAAETVASSAALAVDVVDAVREAVTRWALIPGEVMSHLAHGDFDTSHIYVDPDDGTFTGIIDFGEIRGADRWYDLGHLLLHDGESDRPRLFPHILEGFGAVVPLPEDALVQIRLQAIAIATRALSIQLGRSPSPYRDWLARRLGQLVDNRFALS